MIQLDDGRALRDSRPMPTYEIILSTDISEGAMARAEACGPDDLMSLEDARWTPEIKGPFLPMFSAYQLRRAVESRALRGFRPGHGIFVTRRALKEWTETWHAPASPRGSSSTSTAASGPSTTGTTSDAHRTALAIAARLKRSSRST
ncbi:conserved protein of unknown function [Methylorubrum extorquens]|uniref:Uncharacterized protein n=1 Tax=Methylorubrum extorquens TaxID=408 RepID=A0A2N9ATF1_METEX|nr:conserved protein of unknown function [Methylorubrum extorquens]